MKKKYFLNDCTASARKLVEMIQSTGLNADCAPAVAAMGEGYPACSRARKIRYAHTIASTWAMKTRTIAWQDQRQKMQVAICTICARKGFTNKYPQPIQCTGKCQKALPRSNFDPVSSIFCKAMKKGTLKFCKCS